MAARVLVTGGSGFLGQHLVRELQAAGAEVLGLSRSAASDAVLAARGVTPVRGDLAAPEGLAGAVPEGLAAVFHTAADTSQWAPDAPRQTRINVDGTAALAAAAHARGAGLFVHTSSVSSYSHLVHGVLREDVPQRGRESWINYERTKHLGELAVRERMAAGLPAVILQPGHILGPGDTRNWSRMLAMIDTGRLPGAPPGAGAFADVREVAKAHVQAWGRAQAGETFLLGGAHASFLEFVQLASARLGRKAPTRPVPGALIKLVARASDLASRLTGRAPDMTPQAAVFTLHRLQVDSSKAIDRLGYRETPLAPLLDDTLAWMRAEGMLRG